ncbi:putative autophagy-related protein 11 isoform X2 [Diabrotica virgifera virgifera]|uniref:Uncharacterized protein n=1 Tax=Diabrotica virgifera virgifera TaxID=50390 RepID=A0ABM5K9F9_DIAVI|nr:putative autophagy-related protein 11 isoform X2 [Diabrotica virgifera virgifera]
MSKDTQNMALDMSGSDITMEVVLKNIYTSCDPNNLNSVPTSELIEFIRPYMLEDLHISILDEKLLPYSQSTPRASFGQKLLSCEGLLNLSNVSSYNLSPTKQAKEISIGGPEKTILEEEVKQLQHQLNKALKEIEDLKMQLACTEDQNDVLQDNLEKYKLKLQSEQQINHFQENKNCVDDLKEEINVEKKRIEELNKKLLFYEKDNNHLNVYVQRLEKENSELEERCTNHAKNEQNMRKEHLDLRTHLDLKEHEITSLTKRNDELRSQLNDKMSEMEKMVKEYELLDSKQQGLEKMLSKRYSLSSDYNSCLDEMSFLMRGSTIPIYSSPLKNKSFSNSPSLRKTVLSPNPNMLQQVLGSTPKQCNGLGMRKAFSLNTMSTTRSLPNIFCFDRSTVVQDQVSDVEHDSQSTSIGAVTYESLQTELFQVDPQFDHRDKNGKDFEYFEEQIYFLKAENEALQKSLERLEEEKKVNDSHKLKSDRESTEKIKYLEDNLQELNKDYSKLKLECDQKENQLSELRNKFDFEVVFKKLEIEYSKKVEEAEKLQEALENAQTNSKNIRNSKLEELEKTLAKCKMELLQTKDKLKQSELAKEEAADESIKVKLQESRNTIEAIKSDLENKVKQINQLKDIIKSEGETKTKLLQDNTELANSLELVRQDYKSLLSEMGNKEKELHGECGNMLRKYTEEMSKNTELSSQLAIQKEETSNLRILSNKINSKYETALNKNFNMLKQLSLIKDEVSSIRKSQITCKSDIKIELNVYENSLQSLYSKVKDLECENIMLKKLHSKLSQVVEYKDGAESDQEKGKQFLDVDSSSESSMSLNNDKSYVALKHRSFEKQKLTIERLREELRIEKAKHDMLKERMHSQVEALEKDKQTLQTVINDLKIELQDQGEHYKHLCDASNRKIKDLSVNLSRLEEQYRNTVSNLTEKESLIKRYFEAQECNKAVIQKLENDFKNCQNIQSCLAIDLAAKEATITNISIENQNLKKFAKSSENIRLELAAKVSQQETALKTCKADLVNKNKELSELSSVLLDRDTKITSLLQQESDLKTCKADLANKDKELAELSSVLLDRDNKIEHLAAAVHANEIKMSNVLLEIAEKNEANLRLEEELQVVRDNFAKTESMLENTLVSSEQKSKNEFEELNGTAKIDTTLETISSFTDIIADCCQDLQRTFMNFIQQWKNEIESHPSFKLLPSIKLCHSLDVEDILSVLVDNIKAVVLLLNIMTSKAPKKMIDKSDPRLICPTPLKFTEYNESKPVKRFTLKSPDELRLTRSASPDSPGIETDSDMYMDECEPGNISPDSQTFRTCFEGMDHGENADYCCTYSQLPLLSFEMPFQDAFPHLSDNILGKLGLHETSPKVKLTKEETEEIFTALAIQVSLDSKDIRDRLQKHKDFCSKKYKKYQYLLKDISVRLREHNCIGAMDSIRPVFIMLEDLRLMTKDLLQSVGQLGVLNCEHRMTKCWNLVTNYMAIIKQDADISKDQYSLNRSQLSDEMSNSDTSGIHERHKSIDKRTKEVPFRQRSCMSKLAHCISWISFFALLFIIGVVYVHCRCKLTTKDKICPLDNFIGMVTEIIGQPPF